LSGEVVGLYGMHDIQPLPVKIEGRRLNWSNRLELFRINHRYV
jgi:hypothetical protein